MLKLSGFGRTYKLKCGRADELASTIHKYDLSTAKHIFIGTGTNDPQYEYNATEIFVNLCSAAEELSQSGPKVHLAQLPPRLDDLGGVIDEVNELIQGSSIPNVVVVTHSNITEEDMHDDKHVRIKEIRKLVGNMKNSMRKFNGIEATSNRLHRTDQGSRGSPRQQQQKHLQYQQYQKQQHDHQKQQLKQQQQQQQQQRQQQQQQLQQQQQQQLLQWQQKQQHHHQQSQQQQQQQQHFISNNQENEYSYVQRNNNNQHDNSEQKTTTPNNVLLLSLIHI